MPYPVKVFSTRGSNVLAEEVCKTLETRLPKDLWPKGCLKLGRSQVVRFSNENLQVQVENVRDRFVVVIHSQVPPVNERLVEFFCLLDALKGARPVDILVVFPYYPYARSDKKNQPRISTMAYRLAHILNHSFGIERVMLLDPHDDHIKHYFDPVADEITSIYLFLIILKKTSLISSRKKKAYSFSRTKERANATADLPDFCVFQQPTSTKAGEITVKSRKLKALSVMSKTSSA